MSTTTKSSVDSLHNYFNHELNSSMKTYRWCKYMVWLDSGFALGCIIIGIMLLQYVDYYLHLSYFFFCVSLYQGYLAYHQHCLAKANLKLSSYQTNTITGLKEIQKSFDARETIKDHISECLNEWKNHIVSCYLCCKDQSVFLILVYSINASGIPKKIDVLNKELNKIAKGVDIQILCKADDGKDYSSFPKMIPGSLQYDKENGWVDF